ncbi:Uu.00g047400.m01.CDS01 [Anthostomella pinea]|uniref:Uu.00g047400.m01.CDS01 n=1 Tax=Anthostomella pinea TaxID=933095 RepID=A0AAI8YEL5_9PEZI|nr:Uu.00g047400.m01.CDS01 [Anthostomella pinea]
MERATTRQHRRSPPKLTQAVDSGEPVSQRDGTRAGLGRWFGEKVSPIKGKRQSEDVTVRDRDAQPKPSPRRPARPPIKQSPASFSHFPGFKEARPPTPPPKDYRPTAPHAPKPVALPLPRTPQVPIKSPRMNRKNLGRPGEALGSHPVAPWLDSMAQRMPRIMPTKRELVPSATREHNRRAVVYPGEDMSHIVIKEPRLSSELLAERRRGQYFSQGQPNFHEFPDPTAWEDDDDDEDEEEYDDGQYWEDAGFDDEQSEPETEVSELKGSPVARPGIPEIWVYPPSDGTIEQGKSEGPSLTAEHAYKRICEEQQRELSRLKCSMEELAPLAWLIIDAQRILPGDGRDLATALKDIIEDSEKLAELRPMATALARDQGLEHVGFGEYLRGLQNVFADRDEAKRAAARHKKMRLRAEQHVRDLQDGIKF